MIIYFSATGNTEYVAKYMADLLEDDILNIAFYSKKNQSFNVSSEKPYVILSPVYISTVPTFVMDLLNKSTFNGSPKMYFIMTCAGESAVSASAVYARKLCQSKNLEYMGIHHLSMPQDYLMFFKIQSYENNKMKFDKAIKQIPTLVEKIKNNKMLSLEKVGLGHRLSIKPVIWIFDKFCIKPKKFYITEECISCGICSRVCPLSNIKMNENNKPIWGENCVHCSACINRCPKNAIEYGKKTKGKDRYIADSYKQKNSLF